MVMYERSRLSQIPRTKSLEVVLGMVPLVLGAQLLIWLVYFPAAVRGYGDFRNCYSTAVLVRTGHAQDMYDHEVQHRVQDALISPTATGMPYVHPAYEALLFLPFSFFTYRGAFLAWLGLNLVLVFMSYRLLGTKLWRLHEQWSWL